jgi:uncharacterized membrane protein YbhN (UPF0104 family)
MTSKSSRFSRLTAIIKWLIAAGVLFYLFHQVDKAKLTAALSSARLEIYLPLSVCFVVIWFLIESQNLAFLFNMFGHDLTFREMRFIRGASYMLMIINYNLGLGAIAWYLKRRNHIPLSRAGSVMFFYYFVESVGITFFAMAGCLLVYRHSPVIYGKIILIAGLMFFSYITLFFLVRFIPSRGFFTRFRESALLAAFYEADFPSYFMLSGLRAVYFASFITFFYFGLSSFDVHVPLLYLIGLVPVIFFIGNIPVTPFGIGTIQAAMMFFFRPFGPEENILSFSVAYTATLLFFRAPIGLIYLRETKTGLSDIASMEAET